MSSQIPKSMSWEEIVSLIVRKKNLNTEQHKSE